jgi:hypothetical protein
MFYICFIARPNFITIYDTTSTNTYLSLKDRTDKELQSSVVYKFTELSWNLAVLS